MIAHRLWTIRTADRMLVIEKGRIIETGRHKGSDSGEGALPRVLHASVAAGVREWDERVGARFHLCKIPRQLPGGDLFAIVHSPKVRK